MPDPLQQLRDFLSGLEPARRRALLAASAASVAAIAAVGFWASQPDYVFFTRAADADEAAEITRSLSAGAIPFHVDTDGLTVRVLAASELDARKATVSDGGIVGYEGLEKIDPWVTPFQEQLHLKRMMQGELMRMINSLTGVASSGVELNLPEKTAFLREQERATAAVTLRPDHGVALDAMTARSVAQLVAHAVEGMTAQDVSVIDASTTRILWGEGASGASDGDLTTLAAAQEAMLSGKVRDALTTFLGPNASSVSVRVELETAATKTTTNTVDPDTTVATHEQITSDVDARTAVVAAGPPGTDSNIPERTPTGSPTSTGSKRDSQDTSYDFNHTVVVTDQPAGDIRRLSAAVIVDSAAFARLVAGGNEADVRKQLDSAVRDALGATTARGDTVTVDVLPFAAAPTTDDAPAVPVVPVWQSVLPSAVAALAVVLAFLFFVRPLMKAIRPAPPVPANSPMVGDLPPAKAEEDEEEYADLAARIHARIARLKSHHPRDVSELVRAESEHSAEVLRRWIRA